MSSEAWVDDLSRRYDDLLKAKYQDRLAEDWLRVAKETGLRHRDGLPLSRSLRPLFVSRQSHDSMMAACSAVGRALHTLCETSREDIQLRRELGIDEAFDGALSVEPDTRRRPPVIRLDGFSATPGAITFLEANAMPASFLESEVAGDFFVEAPIMADLPGFRFSHAPLTRRIMRSFRAASSLEGDGGLTTAYIGTEDMSNIPSERKSLIEHLAKVGFRYVEATAADAEMRGGKLHVKGEPIDMLLLQPFLQMHLHLNPALATVHEAVSSGAVRLQVGPCGMFVVSNKASFDVLTDETQAYRFGREAFAELQKHVPWTRRVSARKTRIDGVEIDLLEYASRNRENLVLKPSFGSQGHEVMLGWKTDASAWDAALHAATRGHHVLQRRAALSQPVVFPLIGDSSSVEWVEMLSDVNPYVWLDGVAEGVLVRLSGNEILNVATGGTIAPLVVVDRD